MHHSHSLLIKVQSRLCSSVPFRFSHHSKLHWAFPFLTFNQTILSFSHQKYIEHLLIGTTWCWECRPEEDEEPTFEQLIISATERRCEEGTIQAPPKPDEDTISHKDITQTIQEGCHHDRMKFLEQSLAHGKRSVDVSFCCCYYYHCYCSLHLFFITWFLF